MFFEHWKLCCKPQNLDSLNTDLIARIGWGVLSCSYVLHSSIPSIFITKLAHCTVSPECKQPNFPLILQSKPVACTFLQKELNSHVLTLVNYKYKRRPDVHFWAAVSKWDKTQLWPFSTLRRRSNNKRYFVKWPSFIMIFATTAQKDIHIKMNATFLKDWTQHKSKASNTVLIWYTFTCYEINESSIKIRSTPQPISPKEQTY